MIVQAIIRPASIEEVRPLLSRVLTEKTDTGAGSYRIDDLLDGCDLWAVSLDGELVAAYSVQVEHNRGGSVAWVTAAAGGVPGADLVRDVLPHVERQYRDCAQVAVITRRPGLIRKMKAAGYRETGVTLRKGTNHGR